MKLLLIFCFYSFFAYADLNHETHDFSFEYGLQYSSVSAVQKSNKTEGRLTSPQMPYWTAAYTFRMSQNWGIKFSGGLYTTHFQDPAAYALKNEKQTLNHLDLELIHKISPNTKLGYFIMEQERPLYYAKGPTDIEVTKEKFMQAGLHWVIGQRRRIGLIWGLGFKGFSMFPKSGGNVATEAGVGAEGYARLGWTDPFGTLYQIKGFYHGATAPNAEVEFTHEMLGYCFLVSHTF